MKTRFSPTRTGALLLLLLCAWAYAQDTFIFAGAQLTMPDGWSIQTERRMATLLPPSKGAFVEVYSFSKVPEADIKVITDLLKPRKNTTDVNVTKAVVVEQNGLKGTSAEGVAKIKSVPVRFKIIALPIGSRAVLAISFVAEKEVDKFQKDLDGILGSLKTASKKPER